MRIEEILERVKQVRGLSGMTLNEKLFATHLLDTFDAAKKKDKQLATTILKALGVNTTTIKSILQE